MTSEAVIIELWGQPKGEPVRMNCADSIMISKGTLLALSGASVKTVKPSSEPDKPFGGIAAEEKVASDGQTTIGVWTKGIFDLATSGGVTYAIGELVKISGANIIDGAVVEADIVAGEVVGKTLEASAAGTPERIQVVIGGAFR